MPSPECLGFLLLTALKVTSIEPTQPHVIPQNAKLDAKSPSSVTENQARYGVPVLRKEGIVGADHSGGRHSTLFGQAWKDGSGFRPAINPYSVLRKA